MSSQSYGYLKDIDFVKIYSDEDKIENQLTIISDEIKNCLLNDFEELIFEKKIITAVAIEYDNPDYRQSATGIIYNLNFINDVSFKIYIEVLVDLNRILICTKGIPEKESLKELNIKIVTKYNYESKTELKEIL